MEQAASFQQVLEAVEQLSPEEQEVLVDIMHKRLAELGRKQLAANIREARQEFAESHRRPATPEEILREIAP